jgi:hypothetical protein
MTVDYLIGEEFIVDRPLENGDTFHHNVKERTNIHVVLATSPVETLDGGVYNLKTGHQKLVAIGSDQVTLPRALVSCRHGHIGEMEIHDVRRQRIEIQRAAEAQDARKLQPPHVNVLCPISSPGVTKIDDGHALASAAHV